MKKVLVFSRLNFKKFIDTLTDKQKEQIAFIQINEPRDGEIYCNQSEPIQPSDMNVLNLWFSDIEDECIDDRVPFNEEMANDIWNFVQLNSDKNLFIIHCLAGQCRSGAVGDVLSEYFEIPYENFIRQNPQIKPNTLVKNVLRRQLYGNSSFSG